MRQTIALVGLLALTACAPTTYEAKPGIDYFRDRITGCEYITTNGGITPRMKPDGTQFCVGTYQE